MSSYTITVIINTYNWPQALKLQLLSLNNNSLLPDEVIITDDGSDEKTQQMLANVRTQLNFPLTHLWQEDKGFRVAQARNKAIQQAKGDYLIFLDHDYLVRQHFIRNHRALAEKGYFVSGSRILLSAPFTQRVLTQQWDLSQKKFWWFLWQRFNKRCNRFLTTLPLPLHTRLRKLRRHSWKSTRNLIAAWRQDIIAVNGYDHHFEGWGYEDSDLVIRLQRAGIQRKLGKFATEVMHLHHPIANRDKERCNYRMLMASLNKERPLIAADGLAQITSEETTQKKTAETKLCGDSDG